VLRRQLPSNPPAPLALALKPAHARQEPTDVLPVGLRFLAVLGESLVPVLHLGGRRGWCRLVVQRRHRVGLELSEPLAHVPLEPEPLRPHAELALNLGQRPLDIAARSGRGQLVKHRFVVFVVIGLCWNKYQSARTTSASASIVGHRFAFVARNGLCHGRLRAAVAIFGS
jgi:hypothetical protein